VRNVCLRGKCKLADKWESTPYIVVAQPNADIPVYEVKKDKPHVRTTRLLHRNLLRPLGVRKSDRYVIPAQRPGSDS